MENIWSFNPHVRLNASKKISNDKSELIRNQFCDCKNHYPWPYGMPTSINPYVVLLGASPGNSPDIDAINSENKNYLPPTLGSPHQGLFYKDNRNFFIKVRFLIEYILDNLYGISNKEDALSLGGLMNLDTGENGQAKNVIYNDEFTKWVVNKTLHAMKPRIVVCLGLLKEKERILSLVNSDINSNISDINFDFTSSKNYKFRIWIKKDENNNFQLIIFWPNHPSRVPFANINEWERSVYEFCKYIKVNCENYL